MAPAKSDQNSSNQPATPPQYQTDQGPTPWANDTEHDKQPMEQEISVAIVRPWYTIVPITDQIRAEHERVLSEHEPLPDDDIDDFADEPLPTPFDPKSSTVYDWAKPEAFIQEKDGEGNDYRRISFLLLTSNRTNSMAQSNYGAC